MPILYDDATVLYDQSNYTYNGDGALSVTPSDSVTLAEAFAKGISLVKTESLSLQDALSKAISAGFDETALVLVDAQGKAVELAKTDTAALADAINAGLILTLALADSIMETELYDDSSFNYNSGLNYDGTGADHVSLVVQFFRTFADNLSLSDALAKAIGRRLADTVSLSDLIPVSIGYSVRPEMYATLVLSPKTVAYNMRPKITTVQKT